MMKCQYIGRESMAAGNMLDEMRELINKLERNRVLTQDEFRKLIGFRMELETGLEESPGAGPDGSLAAGPDGNPGAAPDGNPDAWPNGNLGAAPDGNLGAGPDENLETGLEESPGAGLNGSPGAWLNGSPAAAPDGSPDAGPNGSPGAGPDRNLAAGPDGSPGAGQGERQTAGRTTGQTAGLVEKPEEAAYEDALFRANLQARELDSFLFEKADRLRRKYYGNKIYIRGLIEFTNYCRNDCYYCGIRRSNQRAQRYRLTKDEILECCERGYDLGFRTFVLQGGEDPWFTDERMTDVVSAIHSRYGDCAVTLSIGERSRASYQAFFDAGADRFLLRHETADTLHYGRLHPPELSLENRKRCLRELKEIGYQVGCGFMVGSPGQTADCLAQDMMFLHELQPHMVGIGPFIPHHDTPFAGEPGGTAGLTLFLLGLCRLMLPEVLLPATTALGTAAADGRERGILAGANVVMPNLSPGNVRRKYLLYDNKICTGDEAAESRRSLEHHMAEIGFEVVVHRGDHI